MAYIPVTGAVNVFASYQSAMIQFFRSRNALSPENAIEVEQLDWLQMGFSATSDFQIQLKYYRDIIKTTADGKYWLDVSGFSRFQLRQWRILGLVFGGMGTIELVISLLGLILEPTDTETILIMAIFGFLFLAMGIFFHRKANPPDTSGRLS